MGQPINVVEKPTSTPGIARFETNRSLTGMGHERYRSVDDVLDDRPVDVLARRLFETGGVTEVHANGSVVTVHLTQGWTGTRLLDVIRDLYIFYPPTSNGAAASAADEPEADADEPAAEPDVPVTGESAPSGAEPEVAATVSEHGESAAAVRQPVADDPAAAEAEATRPEAAEVEPADAEAGERGPAPTAEAAASRAAEADATAADEPTP